LTATGAVAFATAGAAVGAAVVTGVALAGLVGAAAGAVVGAVTAPVVPTADEDAPAGATFDEDDDEFGLLRITGGFALEELACTVASDEEKAGLVKILGVG